MKMNGFLGLDRELVAGSREFYAAVSECERRVITSLLPSGFTNSEARSYADRIRAIAVERSRQPSTKTFREIHAAMTDELTTAADAGRLAPWIAKFERAHPMLLLKPSPSPTAEPEP